MANFIKKIEIGSLKIGIRVLKTMLCVPDGSCRYTPTCSHYAQNAIYNHNILKASVLIIWRLLRCNPLNKGGYDPIEEKSN